MFKDINKFKEDIFKKTGYAEFDGSKKDLITFCPRCENLRFHSKKHGHLYIKLDEPVFNCFKCNFKGFLTKVLYEFKLNPDDYFDKELALKNFKNFDTDRWIEENDSNLILENHLENIDHDKIMLDKIEYIESRLHHKQLKYTDIDGLILNIKDFIIKNKIEYLLEKPDFIDYLDRSFVGFLLTRKSSVICRNIDTTSKFRFYTIKLGKQLFFKDFYSIKTNELNNNELNNIVLAEGIFDILNIYKLDKVKHIVDKSCILATALTNNYKELIISVLDYLKLPCANFTIMSDAGITDLEYVGLCFNPSIKSLTIVRNLKGKDFGEKDVEIQTTVLNKSDYRKLKNN